jgi:hypothetical protein
MPAFSEVFYNPSDVIVAKLNSDNTFGTPQRVDYFNKISFEIPSDNDEIMTGGMIVEKLSIAKEVDGTFEMGAMNYAAASILYGDAPVAVYGSTPNQYQYLDLTTGGAGNPYFAMIVRVESTNGGAALLGFMKCILKQKPGFTMDQNKFRIGPAGFNAVAPSQVIRRACRVVKYETAPATLNVVSGLFTGFFNGMV